MYEIIRRIASNENLITLLSRVINLMPHSIMTFTCRQAFATFKWAKPQMYNQILNNMQEILAPYYSQTEIQHFCNKYYENLILTMIEILFMSSSLSSKIDSFIEVKGQYNLDLTLDSGNGALLFSSHTGNIFYYYYYLSRHYPTLAVATAMDSNLHKIYMIFHRLGCQAIDYDTANKREMLKSIKQHLSNNGIVVLFGDFWRPDFPESLMFGRTTRTLRGTAGLALNNRVPVIPFYGYRTQGFKHKIIFEKPEYLNQDFNLNQKQDATNYLNGFLEAFIITEPSQWFYWFNSHERWETV